MHAIVYENMNIILYAILWLSFGLGHSITAKISVQEKINPLFGKYYRLLYNGFAAAHILLVLYLGTVLLAVQTYPWFTHLEIFMNLIQLLGLMFIAIALTQYDLMEFSGLSAFSNKRANTVKVEKLNTSGLNGLIRHPLYTGAFVYLWGGAISELGLFTAIFGSLYLLIGSHHEEKKLVHLYGDAYRHYQQNVPRFFPRITRQKKAH